MSKDKIRFHAIGMVIGLILQYILGIITNLFVKFPESGSEKEMWKFTKTQPPLLLHMLLGILLPIGAITLTVRAFYLKSAVWKIPSLLGLISILIAAYAGIRFVPSQSDAYSLVMALGFILALLSYFWGIYRSAKS